MRRITQKTFRRFWMSFALMLLSSGIALAQQKVTGTIVDPGNQPIIGATVVAKGTSAGAVTDAKGNYSLTVPASANTLVFSFMGYVSQELPVQPEMRVVLQESAVDIEAVKVVQVGFGTVRRSELTGAVSSMDANALKDIPLTNPAEAITGRLTGVRVTTTEGSPDAQIEIKVRGGGSISQDNSPLYIVDGFPVSNINSIPPSDIQSIDVLKDASTTAVYGARGANGVVIITTKGGTEGKMTVDFNAFLGVKQITKYLGVMNPYDYVMYQYEIDQSSTFQNYYGLFQDLDIYKSDRGINWQKKVFGETGLQQNYNVGINGGSKMVKYNLSYTHADENSIMLGSGYTRDNVSLKLNSEISKRVSFDFVSRMASTQIDGAGVSSGSGATTRLRNSVKFAPTRGLRQFGSDLDDEDSNNSPEASSLLYDPVQSTLDEYQQQRRFALNYNAGVNLKLVKNLIFRSEVGYEYDFNHTDYVWGPATSYSKSNSGGLPAARKVNLEGNVFRNANTLTYDNREFLPRQSLNVLLGHEVVSKKSQTNTTESRMFAYGMKVEDILANMNFGEKLIAPTTSIATPDNLLSFFTRINYAYNDRYLVTVTFRADGSSKFSRENRWGYFPSGAFAWRVGETQLVKQITWISSMKLRASYGTAGNNRIGDGLYKQLWSTNDENKPYFLGHGDGSLGAVQLIPNSTLYNPNIKWETTVTRNLGLDYGLFKGRINGSIDVYWNTTKDLLLLYPLPANSGYTNQQQNIGQTSNKGLEILVNAVILNHRDYSLDASFNISFNRNRVDKFFNGEAVTYSSGWNGSATPTEDYIVQEGRPLGEMYGYVTDGMYSFDDFTFNTTSKRWEIKPGVPDNSSLTAAGNYFGPGALKFKKLSDDGTSAITNNDKTVIGHAQPKHIGGFSLSGRWKWIDASVFFNWSYGFDVYNANKLDFTAQLLSRRYQNLSSEMSLGNRFTTIDPATGLNIYHGNNADPAKLAELNKDAKIWMPLYTSTVLHSWAIEDGSYLRLNNLTVGVTIPSSITRKFSIQNLRIYATGTNLWLWTKYSGFDPEVDTRRSTPLTPNVDYSAYPRSRTFIFGINLTF